MIIHQISPLRGAKGVDPRFLERFWQNSVPVSYVYPFLNARDQVYANPSKDPNATACVMTTPEDCWAPDVPDRADNDVHGGREEAVLPLTQVGERSVWCARGHPLE